MKSQDLFGQALLDWAPGKATAFQIERDDGLVQEHDLGRYFRPYEEFSEIEKQALRDARGRVLDVGCGSGRHALYLQERGCKVSAIDICPAAVQVARQRGVRDVRQASACEPLPFPDATFDTVLMMGNTLGICGDVPRTRAMLQEFARLAAPRARLIAHSAAPGTTNPLHLNYLKRNLERGRTPGLIRIRVRYQGQVGPWFDLLFLAPEALLTLAWQTGWQLEQVHSCGDLERGYIAVLSKP